MTSHPKDATKELIDTVAECDKVCKHLHLPFQSGSNRILSLMNRKYTREKYIDLVNYSRSVIPELVLTSDVIVGFPTETEEDFLQTLSLVNDLSFQGLYTFIYSVRNGTPAAKMEQVEDAVKHERFKRLYDLQNYKSAEFNKKYIGKTVKILVDGYMGNRDSMMTGRTEGNVIVNFPSCNVSPGSFLDVNVERALNWAVFGNAIIK